MSTQQPRQCEDDVVTVWWCERCCEQGVIAMPRDTGVYGGFQQVWDAHHAASLDCPDARDSVRVRISEDGR